MRFMICFLNYLNWVLSFNIQVFLCTWKVQSASFKENFQCVWHLLFPASPLFALSLPPSLSVSLSYSSFYLFFTLSFSFFFLSVDHWDGGHFLKNENYPVESIINWSWTRKDDFLKYEVNNQLIKEWKFKNRRTLG